jgi:hypothetical protein
LCLPPPIDQIDRGKTNQELLGFCGRQIIVNARIKRYLADEVFRVAYE